MIFKRLSTKLILLVSFTAVIIIGVFAFISLTSQRDVLIEEVQRHANQLSETVKKSTHDEMLVNRREHIISIIEKIAEEPNIKEIKIFNKAGEVIYSSDKNSVGVKLSQTSENCIVCHSNTKPVTTLKINDKTRIFRLHPDSTRVIGVINPIYNEWSCYTAECHAHSEDQSILGLLDITVDLRNVDYQLAKSELLIVILALVSIISLGLIIAFFINRWVDKPVKKIVEATNKLAVGNLNYRISSTSKDELGVLSNSFDRMTKNLSEMKMQLFQSDKMASLGQLAAGVAHEINNPLTGVLTYSSYLLKRAKGNPELESDLNVIVRETKRSREIVKQLLDFARQSVPKRIKTDVNVVIDRALNIVLNEIKIKNAKVELLFDNELPEIVVDPNQIQQVFINLIVNALDSLREQNGIIKIKTEVVSLSPKGIIQIKKAVCPNSHNLMDEEHKIEGLPSIKVKAKYKQNEGYIHLDPIYGLHRHHYGIPLIKDKPFELSCPTCDVSLMVNDSHCPECGSSYFKLTIPEKGELIGCSKFGGTWQKWEYIDEKGKSDYLQIKIEDNGEGISNETLERIFDPFFSTKGQKGTGLGLSVVWGIVDNHNGRINVESKVGIGTTFKIKFPVVNK